MEDDGEGVSRPQDGAYIKVFNNVHLFSQIAFQIYILPKPL